MPYEDLCRFDSPDWLGDLLIGSMDGIDPQSILDLGCGGGALSLAAAKRWPRRHVTTIDLDKAAEGEVHRAFRQSSHASHRHVTADVLNAELHSLAAHGAATVDLVLSNPPYRSAAWTTAFGDILMRAGFPPPAGTVAEIPMDLVFVAQALHLVRPGGSLGLILPDSLIAGYAMREFRRALIAAHRVRRVIQLPRRAFRGTDAQAYVMIVERGGGSDAISLDRIHADGTWRDPVVVDVERAIARLDHSFHEGDQDGNAAQGTSLRDLGVRISRGDLRTIDLANCGHPTFHTTDFPKTPGAAVELRGDSAHEDRVWARPGDVLLARVDRSLERKIALVSSGTARLSDCVLRLRCPETSAHMVLAGLCSARGQRQLTARARGTGARHISATSMLDIRV